jgi:hypothetical protein
MSTSDSIRNPGPAHWNPLKYLRFSVQLRIMKVEHSKPSRLQQPSELLELTQARAGQIVNGLVQRIMLEDGPTGLALTSKARNWREGNHPEQPELEFSHEFVMAEIE